jgi:ribosomal protein L40E
MPTFDIPRETLQGHCKVCGSWFGDREVCPSCGIARAEGMNPILRRSSENVFATGGSNRGEPRTVCACGKTLLEDAKFCPECGRPRTTQPTAGHELDRSLAGNEAQLRTTIDTSSMNPRRNPELRKGKMPDFLAYLEKNGVCLECQTMRPDDATTCQECGTVVFFKGAKRCNMYFDDVIFPDEDYKKCPTCNNCPREIMLDAWSTADWAMRNDANLRAKAEELLALKRANYARRGHGPPASTRVHPQPSTSAPVYETARFVQRGSLKRRSVVVVSTPGRGEWEYAESEPYVIQEKGWQKKRI